MTDHAIPGVALKAKKTAWAYLEALGARASCIDEVSSFLQEILEDFLAELIALLVSRNPAAPTSLDGEALLGAYTAAAQDQSLTSRESS